MKYYQIIYKRISGARCGENDDWDKCEVSPLGNHSSFGTHVFERDQTYQRDALLWLLSGVFKCGENSKLNEIQNTLGIKR